MPSTLPPRWLLQLARCFRFPPHPYHFGKTVRSQSNPNNQSRTHHTQTLAHHLRYFRQLPKFSRPARPCQSRSSPPSRSRFFVRFGICRDTPTDTPPSRSNKAVFPTFVQSLAALVQY